MDIVKSRENIKKIASLSFQIAKVEFKLRNEGSYLGVLWYLLNPALMFVLLLAIFNQGLTNSQDVIFIKAAVLRSAAVPGCPKCYLQKLFCNLVYRAVRGLYLPFGIGIGYFLGSSDGSAKKTALLSGGPPPGTSVTETLESGGTRKETVTNTPPTGAPIPDVQKGQTEDEKIPDSPPLGN